MRRRRNQGDARHGIAQLRDIRRHLIAWQLTAFSWFRALRHFNLNNVGVDQISWRHAKAARGDLLDARHFIGAVTCGIFAAFAGVRISAQAVHRFRQRLMRFRAERADRHRGGIKTLIKFSRGLDLIQTDWLRTRLNLQQIAQRGDWTFVNRAGVELIVAILAALHRFLQRRHHVRVVGVVLAAVNIFQQPALIQRFALQPGAFRQVNQILLEIGEVRAVDAADHALEAERRNIFMQADRFEQFGAAIRGDSRNAHFGHDLI